MFLTITNQRTDPKSYEKKKVTAEVINSSANKKLDSPKENIFIYTYIF